MDSYSTHLVQVDHVELLAGDTVEETALLVDENDLERLELLCELSGGNVGIDVQDLTVCALRERGENGQRASTNGSLDGPLVDARDLADEAVLGAVEVVGGEDA